ncbi:class I SAM-dependent methyltransferase [Longimicrobium sp.]|uniref:class I SAM-dependent methyltransferase n=1 Tax=Longimicrobium sp. TaxID=2029185 RepID=UPI002E335998|nr:class I SAM-dependent methyltransferase [Longimicrobium sp.]HEX6039321.1 class I SAM-dependent methyltransferase [Longimicrobium sp.]
MSDSAYARSADFYDLVYGGKPYADEAAHVHVRIQAHLRSGGNALLDVGCGTGGHVAHFLDHYRIEGLDLDEGLLRIAAERYPDATFHRGDMTDFDLGRAFDAVVCLFSAIGYVRTEDALRRTVAGFARHLRPGGVVVVEPWLTPDVFRPGTLRLDASESAELKVARIVRSDYDGDLSVLVFSFLVGRPEGVEHWEERHLLGLFADGQMRDAFAAAGLEVVEHDPHGLTGRGLYVARRPEFGAPAPAAGGG